MDLLSRLSDLLRYIRAIVFSKSFQAFNEFSRCVIVKQVLILNQVLGQFQHPDHYYVQEISLLYQVNYLRHQIIEHRLRQLADANTCLSHQLYQKHFIFGSHEDLAVSFIVIPIGYKSLDSSPILTSLDD